MSEKIRVLAVRPYEVACEYEIENNLKALQDYVDGYIECLYCFPDEVCLVCNDEGKNMGSHLNRALYDDDGEMFDIVAGDFLICGISPDGEFTSLSDGLLDKYKDLFESPEAFFKDKDGIKVIKFDPASSGDLNHGGLVEWMGNFWLI